MAREKGYERVACDRAEAVHPGGELPIVFMTPEDKRNEEWLRHRVHRHAGSAHGPDAVPRLRKEVPAHHGHPRPGHNRVRERGEIAWRTSSHIATRGRITSSPSTQRTGTPAPLGNGPLTRRPSAASCAVHHDRLQHPARAVRRGGRCAGVRLGDRGRLQEEVDIDNGVPGYNRIDLLVARVETAPARKGGAWRPTRATRPTGTRRAARRHRPRVTSTTATPCARCPSAP